MLLGLGTEALGVNLLLQMREPVTQAPAMLDLDTLTSDGELYPDREAPVARRGSDLVHDDGSGRRLSATLHAASPRRDWPADAHRF
jgi:hypothetical protein